MSRFEDLSYKVIAEKMDISVRTVETKIYRAVRVLHKALEDFTAS